MFSLRFITIADKLGVLFVLSAISFEAHKTLMFSLCCSRDTLLFRFVCSMKQCRLINLKSCSSLSHSIAFQCLFFPYLFEWGNYVKHIRRRLERRKIDICTSINRMTWMTAQRPLISICLRSVWAERIFKSRGSSKWFENVTENVILIGRVEWIRARRHHPINNRSTCDEPRS